MKLQRIDAKRILRDRKPLVILAPHPDDELFGCGLLIAEAVSRGIPVSVIVLTDGQASHPGSLQWPAASLAKLRRAETRHALARLGARNVRLRFMGWRDGHLAEDCQPLRLRRLLASARSATLLATSFRDFHPDHQVAWHVAQALARSDRHKIIAYAVWSRISCVGTRKAVHPALARKQWAARAYRSQIGPYIRDDPDGFQMGRSEFFALLRNEEVYAVARGRPSRPNEQSS